MMTAVFVGRGARPSSSSSWLSLLWWFWGWMLLVVIVTLSETLLLADEPRRDRHHDNVRVVDPMNDTHLQRLHRYKNHNMDDWWAFQIQRMKQRGAAPFAPHNPHQVSYRYFIENDDTTLDRSSSSSGLLNQIYPNPTNHNNNNAIAPKTGLCSAATKSTNKIKITILGGSISALAGSKTLEQSNCRRHDKHHKTKYHQDDNALLLEGRWPSQLQAKFNHDSGHDEAADTPRNAKHSSQGPQFHIANMAQGSTTSVTNALLLHQLLHGDEDVLLWEFHLNDSGQRKPTAREYQEMTRKLDLWLRRVHAFYTQRSLPSILLLYLWPFESGQVLREQAKAEQLLEMTTTTTTANPNKNNRSEHAWLSDDHQHDDSGATSHPNSLSVEPLHFMGNLLNAYRAKGWDIDLMDVGASVNASAILHQLRQTKTRGSTSDPAVFFADMHHPTCRVNGMIADLVQYHVYSKLASCRNNNNNKNTADNNDNQHSQQQQQGKNNPGDSLDPVQSKEHATNHATLLSRENPARSVPPPVSNVLGPFIGNQWEELWMDLLDENNRVTSFSPWKPSVEKNSAMHRGGLQITNLEQIQQNWPLVTKRADMDRADRKHGYDLPKCPDITTNWNQADENKGSSFFVVTLKEPNLKWLGIGKSANAKAKLDVFINNVQVLNQSSSYDLDWYPARMDHHYLLHWLRVDKLLVAKNGESKNDDGNVVLRLCHHGDPADSAKGDKRKAFELGSLVGVISPENGHKASLL